MGKEKEYRAKPVEEESFKLKKFTTPNTTKINTNLSAFQNAAKMSLGENKDE